MSLLPDSALNPDPLDERKRQDDPEQLYKSATQAYDDVVGQPRGLRSAGVQVADASGVSWKDQLAGIQQSAPALKGAVVSDAPATGWKAQLAGLEQPAQTAEQGNFSRGFEVSGKQLKQTAYGTAALLGDTFGSDGLKEWGLKGYKAAEKEVQAISKESDSFTQAWEKGEMGKWLTYSSGYLIGQVAEMGVASLAGAAVGSVAAPGAGTAAGAVAGAVEKGAVQAGVKSFVGKMIDKEAASLVAKGVAADVAADAAVKSVYRTIGATTANTFLNATGELGSIYGDAVQEALDKGQEYSLGKVWLAGIAATAVDSWADSKALGKFVGSFGGDKAIKGVAMEALKGGFREGMTEGVQTAIERWGANKDLTSREAFRDYIDSAAVGVLGGSVAGGASGAINKFAAKDDSGKGKPLDESTTDIQTTGSTKTAEPVDLNAVPAITKRELFETLGNADAVAYLHSIADPEQKKAIEVAVDRAGTDFRLVFNESVGRQDRIDAGAQMLAEAPVQRERLFEAIDQFANTQPAPGAIKVPMTTKRVSEQDQLQRMDEADASLNQGKPAQTTTPAAPAPAAVLTPIDRVQGLAATTSVPSNWEVSEKGKYGEVRYFQPESEMSRSQDYRDSYVTHPALPGLFFSRDKDMFDALKIRKQAIADGEWTGTKPAKSFDAEVSKAESEAKPATVAPVGVESKVSETQRNLNNVQLNEKNRLLLEADFEVKVSDALTMGEGKTRDARLETLRGQMAKVGFQPLEINQVMTTGSFGEPVAQTQQSAEAPAQANQSEDNLDMVNAKLAAAREEVKDSLYNLWDVYSDATGLKKNITGQKYTVSDLPKAIQKVMEALVKLGYTKLEGIAEQLMQRMRVSRDWAHLADNVTPSMLKVAYSKIKFDGKETSQELNAISSERLNSIIRTKFDTSEPVQKQAPKKSEFGPALSGMKGASAETTIDAVDAADPADKGSDLDGEDEGATFRKVQEVKKQPISPSKLSDQLKAYVGSFPQKDQKDVLIRLGEMDEKQRESFERKLVDGIKAAEERKAEAERGKTADLDLDKPQQDTRLRQFKQKVDSILNMNADRGFWQDTLARLNAAVNQIDEALKTGRFMEVDGTKFEAVDESDENAYLWGETGFRDAKSLPKDKLLAVRRQLVDEIRDMQTQSLRGMAALFKQSLSRLDYELSMARTQALRDGIPMDQVDKVYDPARRVLVDFRNEVKGKNKEQSVPQEFQQPMLDAIQGEFFEREKALASFVSDLKAGKLKDLEANRLAMQYMRDGLFTQGELIAELKRAGMDVPQSLVNVSGQVAMQTRMLEHSKANGYKPMFREFWLRSMDHVVKANPGILEGDAFTDGEKLAYEEWTERRDALKLRRKVDEVMEFSNDADQAFDGLLFTRYTLSRMQNPASIPARDLTALEDTVGNLPEAWMQDLAFALKTRPNLRQQITDMIAPAELEQFRQWVQKHENNVKRDIAVNAKAPFLQQLMGMGSLPEEMFEKFKEQILRAQVDQLDRIMANAKKLNDAVSGRSMSEADLELLLADFMEQIQQDESINGQSIEEYFGVKEFGRATDMRDESVADLANSDEGYDFNQSLDTDENGDPSELRFKAAVKGFFSGVLTAAQVQATVARLTNGWKSAPQITVLQNVQMLPEPMRSRVVAKLGDDMSAKGVFDSETGQVYLFSDMLSGEADTEFTLFHEVYGHLGMRGLLGAKFDSFLENMYRVYPNIRKEADALVAEGTPKLEAIEEVLSDLAGANKATGPFKQFVGKVITGLREIGLGRVADWMGQLTNAELAYTLSAARDFAQNGGYRALDGAPSEIRLAEARIPYEMFSQKNGVTSAYARFNPVTQSWAVFRATGEDIRNGYSSEVFENFEDVLDLMRKQGKVERRKRSGLFVDDKLPGDMPKLSAVTDITGMKRWMRDLITKYQNEYRPVFDVVDYLRSKGRINDQMDVKTALMLYERRTGAVVESFRLKYVEPLSKLIDEAGQAGANYDLVNKYLLARHAEERNKQIARVNPNMPDAGSGMSTAAAKEFMAEIKGAKFEEALNEIGRLMDRMSNAKLNYQVNTGMITRKAAESMKAAYQHYVNLSGQNDKLDKFDDPSQLAGGSKFNVKGKEARAMGRTGEASDILARTVLGMEAALIRGQKNLVAQRVLALVESNYDPEFAVVNEIAYKRVIGEDGMVMETEDSDYIKKKDVMVAKINGIPVTIRFKNVERGSFADAIHGMVYPPDSSAWLERVGKYNQLVGQMLTTYNPAWALVNFARDAQTMFLNAASDNRISKAQAFKMARLLPSAIKTAYAMSFQQSALASKINIDPEMRMAFEEMKREGGLTSFLNRKDLDAQVEEIHKLLHERTTMQNVGDKFMAVLDSMEHLTTPMEIGPRLAAYMVVRNAGWSASEAAKFSGEITVNFNMRGSNKEVRKLYLFFNPAVQGSAKLASLFFKLGPDYKLTFEGRKAAAYASAFVALGAIANLVGRAFSDDDDAERNELDKVPVYKRATSMVIAAGVPGAAIPIPYGWNAFYAVGHFGMDTLLGKQPLSETAKRIAKTTFEAFTPMGTAGLDSSSTVGMVAKGLAPTAALPVVEWLMNENRYGAPIRKEGDMFGGAVMPNSEMAFRSVSPISQGIATSLNEITGGNKAKAGAININPAAIDFVIGSYLPGLINETYKGASTAVRVATGEEVKNTPLPLIDRFTAKVPESFDAGAFRRAKELTETAYNEFKLYPERREQIREELPGLMRAHAIVASATQDIRKMRADFAEFERKPTATEAEIVERKNRLREQETKAYARAVKAVMDAGPEFREAVMAAD